jgi:hypothetical protein
VAICSVWDLLTWFDFFTDDGGNILRRNAGTCLSVYVVRSNRRKLRGRFLLVNLTWWKQADWFRGNAGPVFERCRFRILAGILDAFIEGFRGLSQSLQLNSEVVPKEGQILFDSSFTTPQS